MTNPQPVAQNQPLRNRLHSRINCITGEAFGLWEQHQQAGTLETVSHLTKALPALEEVNGVYQGERLLTTLINLMQNREPSVRRRAALALGNMGEHAKEAVPLLLKLLKDKNPHVRRGAAEALGAWQSDRRWELRIFAEGEVPPFTRIIFQLARGKHPFPIRSAQQPERPSRDGSSLEETLQSLHERAADGDEEARRRLDQIRNLLDQSRNL